MLSVPIPYASFQQGEILLRDIKPHLCQFQLHVVTLQNVENLNGEL